MHPAPSWSGSSIRWFRKAVTQLARSWTRTRTPSRRGSAQLKTHRSNSSWKLRCVRACTKVCLKKRVSKQRDSDVLYPWSDLFCRILGNGGGVGGTAQKCWLCSYFNTHWKTRSSIGYRTLTIWRIADGTAALDILSEMCKLGWFRDASFDRLKIYLRRHVMRVWRSELCPISWRLTERSVVSKRYAKAEILSLDVGRITEGVLARQVLETVMDVIWGQNHKPRKASERKRSNLKEIRGNLIDRAPQNAAIISSFGTHHRVGHVTRGTTTWDSKGAKEQSTVHLAGMHKELRKHVPEVRTWHGQDDHAGRKWWQISLGIVFQVRPCGATQGFDQIPISIVVVVGDETGWDVQKDEKSKSKTPRRNMTSKMRWLLGHTQRFWANAGALVKVRACTRKMCPCCASGEVSCVHSPSRAWKLLLLGREPQRKNIQLKTEQSLYANSETGMSCTTSKARFVTSFLVRLWVSSSSVLTFILFPTIFGLSILPVAITAIADDFPSVENPTMSRFVTMT